MLFLSVFICQFQRVMCRSDWSASLDAVALQLLRRRTETQRIGSLSKKGKKPQVRHALLFSECDRTRTATTLWESHHDEKHY